MKTSVVVTGEIESISQPPEEVPLSPATDKGGTIWKQFRPGDSITITGKKMKVTHKEKELTDEDQS